MCAIGDVKIVKIIPENVVAELSLEIFLDWNLSKNRKITRNKQGQTVYNKNKSQVDNLQKTIFYLYKSNNIVFEARKIWVFLTIHKSTKRGDVSNFVDTVADAIKLAIAVDDSYFSFVLDYEIDKKDIIEIRILQEAESE